MNNEFKKIKGKTETRYVLETASAGATGAGAIATSPQGVKELRKRLESLKAQAEGRYGSRSDYDPNTWSGSYRAQRDMDREKSDFKRSELDWELRHEQPGGYSPPPSRGMYFYNVRPGQEDAAVKAGLKQSKNGKWYSKITNFEAEKLFGKGRYWTPKNEDTSEGYDTSEKNRQWYFNPKEWKDQAYADGGKIVKRDDTYVAMGWDGEMGEFDPKTGEGWLVSSYAMKGMKEGLAPGQSAWKKEMIAKGAVSFKRDQHGGGTVDRIVAYDKDGKVVGGFNRKGVAEAAKWRRDDLEGKTWRSPDWDDGDLSPSKIKIDRGGKDVDDSGDELTSRPGVWRGKADMAKRMTKKGVPTKSELGFQANLKSRIKMKQKTGGLTGPKGHLPEQGATEGPAHPAPGQATPNAKERQKSRDYQFSAAAKKARNARDRKGVGEGDQELDTQSNKQVITVDQIKKMLSQPGIDEEGIRRLLARLADPDITIVMNKGGETGEFKGELDSKGRFTRDTARTMFGKLSPDADDMADQYMESLRQALENKLNEKAPPGDKYERMVKHIKKGYAKDGKLTDRERSIAYATAWKAKNKTKK